MTITCELCHKHEAVKTIWLTSEQSPIHVGGIYQVCEKCSELEKEDKYGRR